MSSVEQFRPATTTCGRGRLRWQRGAALGLLAVLTACGLGGCSASMLGALFSQRVYECGGFDVPMSAFVGSSHKELRVHVRARMVDHDFSFVAEAGPETFVMVGFTPLGTKAFTLVRGGDTVVVENMLAPAHLMVPPRNVMEDVLSMSVPSTCATSREVEVMAEWNGWEVRDTCYDSRPLYRRIARPGKPAEIEVDYGPDGISVRQLRCRYQARYVLKQAPPGAEVQAAPQPEAAPAPVSPAPAPAP